MTRFHDFISAIVAMKPRAGNNLNILRQGLDIVGKYINSVGV
jgi:hypothetical protein